MQALDHDRQEALHHLVAEIVIRIAFAAQAGRVDADGAGHLHGAGIEHPAIGRHEPGRADDLAGSQRLEDDRRLAGLDDFERHPAVADQEELVRRLAFVKQVGSRIEAVVAGAAGDEVGVRGGEAGEEGMLLDDAFKPFHSCLPLPVRRGWRPPPP